jgi:hypothetical protein
VGVAERRNRWRGEQQMGCWPLSPNGGRVLCRGGEGHALARSAPISVTALNHGGGFDPAHGESKQKGDQGFGLAIELGKDECKFGN